jgi:PEP-CTERM motif
MSCNTFNRRSGIGPITAASLLVLTAISLFATPAKAVITDTDWSLKISERELAFRPASDAMAMKTLMWDLPASRRTARNLPTICLTNDSATANISQFKMTIGDTKFHFGDTYFDAFAKLGKDTPGFSLSATTENNGDTLVVNFLNGGIAPGQTINFLFDIDVDAAYANSIYKYPDYRTVLFDMNGDNYYEGGGINNDISSDDNSKVSLTFTMAGMPSVTTVPTPFVDPLVLDGSARYVNANIARYGDSDPIRAFNLSGGTAVPEPGSIMLGLIGLVSLCPLFGRRRRESDGFRQAA